MNTTAIFCRPSNKILSAVITTAQPAAVNIQYRCCKSKLATKMKQIIRFQNFNPKFYRPNEHILVLPSKYYNTKLLTSKHFVQVPRKQLV